MSNDSSKGDASSAAVGKAEDSVEFRLNEIWRDQFKKSDLSSDEDFFALGGDSLMAFHVFRRVALEFGVELPITALFDYPTVGTLAEYIGDNMREDYVPKKRGFFEGASFKTWLISKYRKLRGFRG